MLPPRIDPPSDSSVPPIRPPSVYDDTPSVDTVEEIMAGEDEHSLEEEIEETFGEEEDLGEEVEDELLDSGTASLDDAAAVRKRKNAQKAKALLIGGGALVLGLVGFTYVNTKGYFSKKPIPQVVQKAPGAPMGTSEPSASAPSGPVALAPPPGQPAPSLEMPSNGPSTSTPVLPPGSSSTGLPSFPGSEPVPNAAPNLSNPGSSVAITPPPVDPFQAQTTPPKAPVVETQVTTTVVTPPAPMPTPVLEAPKPMVVAKPEPLPAPQVVAPEPVSESRVVTQTTVEPKARTAKRPAVRKVAPKKSTPRYRAAPSREPREPSAPSRGQSYPGYEKIF